ncbi:MAG: hypothetical protein ABIF71_12830 [Planctomycetota bacterium]
MEQQEQSNSSFMGCWFRLFWMCAGNFGLVFSAYFIAEKPGPFLAFSVADIAYGAIAVALVIVRLIDIRNLHGNTAFGTPATIADYRRYVLWLIPIVIVVWLAVHGIAALRS